MTGHDASLRWGYQPAATVRQWRVEKDEQGWCLTGEIVSSDTFRLSQRPIVFHVSHKHGVWQWPVLELQMTGVSLHARLGPKE